jgi:hypothetical protein
MGYRSREGIVDVNAMAAAEIPLIALSPLPEISSMGM